MADRVWTEAEERYICMNACMHSDRSIALHLFRISGKSTSAAEVKNKRQKLGITKPSRRPRKAL